MSNTPAPIESPFNHTPPASSSPKPSLVDLIHSDDGSGYLHSNIMVSLESENVDIDAVDANGSTALILATQRNEEELVKILLGCGASLRIINQNGESAYSIAQANNAAEILNLLEERMHFLNTELIQTILHEQDETTKILTVNNLLSEGAYPNTQFINSLGHLVPVLILATMQQDSEVVSELLYYQANVNFRDSSGASAAIYAHHLGNKDIFNQLLERSLENCSKSNFSPESCSALVGSLGNILNSKFNPPFFDNSNLILLAQALPQDEFLLACIKEELSSRCLQEPELEEEVKKIDERIDGNYFRPINPFASFNALSSGQLSGRSSTVRSNS